MYDAGVIKTVVLSRRAKKDLETVPAHVRVKLLAWVDSVQEEGMAAVRRVPGFHDEPLKGPRTGQRSIRLSKAYRAIYVETVDGDIELALVEEVNKHDYWQEDDRCRGARANDWWAAFAPQFADLDP